MLKNVFISPFQKEYLNEVLEIFEENFENSWNEKFLNFNTPFIYRNLMFIDEKLAGFCELKIVEEEADLQMLVLRKEFQGKGYGTLFLLEILEDLKTKGVKYIFLEVSERNKNAINLYKKFGFRYIDRREKYYRNGDDAIIMKSTIDGGNYENKR